MQNNRIYDTFSIIGFIRLWLARLLIIGTIIGAIYHINDNPKGLSVFIIVLILLLGIIYGETVEIYKDKIIYKKHFILGIYTKSTPYYYKDYKSIGFVGFFTEITDVITDVLSESFVNIDATNSIEIVDKQGKYKYINTYIYRRQLRKAFEIMYKQTDYVKLVSKNNLVINQ